MAQLQMQVITALFLVAAAVQLASSRGLFYYREDGEFANSNSSCTGTPNLNQPWIGQPTFVRQIENGTLYTAGDGEDMIHGMYNMSTYMYMLASIPEKRAWDRGYYY